jgi:hypothetical protein
MKKRIKALSILKIKALSILKIKACDEKRNNNNNIQETNKKTFQQHLASISKKLNLYLLVNYK